MLALVSSKLAIQVVNLWSPVCLQQLLSALLLSGMSCIPFQLPWPPVSLPARATCATYMHLTTLPLSFNPIAKVIFLAYCPSPVTPLFCTMLLALFLCCGKYKLLFFTFQAMSHLQHQEVVPHCHYINNASSLKHSCVFTFIFLPMQVIMHSTKSV